MTGCTALPNETVDNLLNHLNSIEVSIKFAVEYKMDEKLSFLETELYYYSNSTIPTNVRQKQNE